MEIENRLIVDIGNSRVKYCSATAKVISSVKNLSHKEASSHFRNMSFSTFDYAIVSSTASVEFTENILDLLRVKNRPILLSHQHHLPFEIVYETENTLGLDRIANISGGIKLFPKTSLLIIDTGSCITYDLVNAEGIFNGGAISPGLQMRFKSMNDYSGRLPRLTELSELDFPAASTQGNLSSGVYHGILGEINHFIQISEQSLGEVKVLLTGGDAKFFELGIKSPIFANPKLTLEGLNEILSHNI